MSAAPAAKVLDAALDCGAAALFSFFLLLCLTLAWLLPAMTAGGAGGGFLLASAARPLGALALAALLLATRGLDAGRERWGARLLRLAACGVLFAAAAPAPVLLGTAAAWAFRRRGRRAARAASLAAVALVLASSPVAARARSNSLGLVSGRENAAEIVDYSRFPNKDSYPVCRIESNSLGFRDVPPPFAAQAGRKRILLIGDSFVWGDGIASNAETLGELLRARLERARPGRFVVMSAAYPGLGLYGYGRFVDALVPEFRPDVVVVGYLGSSDHDPLDPQRLLDHLPSAPPLRRLVLNAGAPQLLHEASVRRSSSWADRAFTAYFDGLYRDFASKAARGRYRLVFLAYARHPDLPAGIEALDLPPEVLYQGRASDLWYAKDYHPKAKLNRLLAGLLADRLGEDES